MATQATMLTNTYGSLAFQESIRRYAGTERPESNLVMRLYGLVSQERMLIDEKNRCQSPTRSHPQHGAYRKSLKRIVRQLLRVQWNLRSECDAYNSFHSRNVCAAMHYKFPRELRDMVYEHITSEEVTVCTDELASTADPTIPSMSSPLNFLTERWYPPSPCTFKDRLCAAHYWRIGVVGYEVQKEMTESWYHNATFHLEFPRGTREWDNNPTLHRDFLRNTRQYYRPAIVLDHLPRMLWYDRFGLGFKPEQLLRNIVFVLDLPARADDHFGSILTGLDNLALLKQGAKIHLRLRLPHAGRFLEEETIAHALQHWLQYIHPSLWRLRRAGYGLLVTFDRVTTTTAHTQVLDRWKEEFEIEAKKEVPATTSSALTSS